MTWPELPWDNVNNCVRKRRANIYAKNGGVRFPHKKKNLERRTHVPPSPRRRRVLADSAQLAMASWLGKRCTAYPVRRAYLYPFIRRPVRLVRIMREPATKDETPESVQKYRKDWHIVKHSQDKLIYILGKHSHYYYSFFTFVHRKCWNCRHWNVTVPIYVHVYPEIRNVPSRFRKMRLSHKITLTNAHKPNKSA